MIYDHTDVARLQGDFNKYIPKLKKLIESKGGIVKDDFFPTDFESMKQSTIESRNPFCKEYFGVDTIYEAWENVKDDNYSHFDEDVISYYNNFKNYLSRCEASYDVGLLNRFGTQLDPVSALFIALDISIEADMKAYDYRSVTKEWIDHNIGYLSKIGFSSYYYYPLLEETRKGYERNETIELTDEELDIMAEAAVFLQQMVKDMKLKPFDLDSVQNQALGNNNKAAETFPGYGNLKNDEVKARTLARSKFLEENMNDDFVLPFSQLHRIQSGGNVIFDYMTLDIDSESGKLIYNKEMLINAIYQIKNTRGYSTTYVEKEPSTIPELQSIIDWDKLPDSYKLREDLVNSGEEAGIILHKYKGSDDWMYNYKVNFPNVFVLVNDKYGAEYPELGDKIYTKHRSVKASGPDMSRLGQMYLYPIMDELRLRLEGTPFESFVAQWMHPDYLAQLFTNLAVLGQPDTLVNVVDSTINTDAVDKFKDFLLSNGIENYISSDDKSGFDNYQSIINYWLVFCTFLSIPFDMDEKDKRLFRGFIKQSLFSLVIAPEGLHVYQEIIASGGWFTSFFGTYFSNKAGLTVQGVMLSADPNDMDVTEDDEDSEINEVSGEPKVDVEDEEELE